MNQTFNDFFKQNCSTTNTIVGPCAIESEEQLEISIKYLSSLGYKYIRSCIYKPRTNHESYQGIGEKGIPIIKKMIDKYDINPVIEILSIKHYEKVKEIAKIIQVGSRNMQNYELLKYLSNIEQTVILKRGMSSTFEESIGAINYLKKNGKKNIIFCERGIRTFTDYTRNTLDIMSVPIISKETGIPVIIDCSHSTGQKFLVNHAVKAAMGIEANGLMIEVHPDPDNAKSDNKQQLNFNDFLNTNDIINRGVFYE